jgi:hypothetical protein
MELGGGLGRDAGERHGHRQVIAYRKEGRPMITLIEDRDSPSLLELRERVASQLQRWSAAQGNPGEPEGDQLDAVCEALVYLVWMDPGKRRYLTSFWHPAEWDEVEAWLDALAEILYPELVALNRYIYAWYDRFHATGGHPTQWKAFRLAVEDTILEVFATQQRQRLLACYGEAS